jgi:hypothetical protein
MSMTQPDRESCPVVDQALIDRIVDGRMTPGELRAAVDRLERDPDGWKRCALAFLESQVLNESFRTLGRPQTNDAGGPAILLRLAPPRHARHRWLRTVAAAAVVGAAFAIGWLGHGTRMGLPARDVLVRGSGLAQRSPMSEPSGSEHALPADDSPADDRTYAPGDPIQTIRAVGTIRFGPESSPAEVPVLAGPGITPDWLAQQPPPVSEYGQVILARQGYQVEQQRRFITAVLTDGRRVAIPVDHVEIQYTGNEPL